MEVETPEENQAANSCLKICQVLAPAGVKRDQTRGQCCIAQGQRGKARVVGEDQVSRADQLREGLRQLV